MPPIVYPVSLEWPGFTAFVMVNLTVALVCSAAVLWMAWQNPWRLGRPAFVIPALLCLLYQWPMVLLAGPIEISLGNPWAFALTAHVAAVAGIGWVLVTDRLSIPVGTRAADGTISITAIVVPAVAVLGFAAIYFAKVPFHCTALYALAYDPGNALLAREVTIKLAGSTLATMSYGALANSAAPMLAAIGAAGLLSGIVIRRVDIVLLWAVAIVICITAVMIGGAKGLTIPLAGMVLLSAVFWQRTNVQRVIAVGIAMAGLAGALAVFEMVRERGGGSQPYDFARCTQELGTAEQGRELLRSIKESGGLGLSRSQIEQLSEQLGGKEVDRTFSDERPADIARANTLLEAILTRAFISPTQVAAWHFLYVQEHGSPGIGALPLAKKWLGHSVDATSLVYMAYGAHYSGGDVTSTSTAPTSFIFSYPAYYGIVGLIMVLVAMLALDVAVALLGRTLQPNILPLLVGSVAVIGFNLMTSDFVTVMLSHGGAVAFLLLAAMAALSAIRRPANPHPA